MTASPVLRGVLRGAVILFAAGAPAFLPTNPLHAASTSSPASDARFDAAAQSRWDPTGPFNPGAFAV